MSFAFLPNQVDSTNVGQIQLANFVNPNGLKSIGGNLYVESAASGPPIEGNPGEGTFGTILQKFLEVLQRRSRQGTGLTDQNTTGL